MRRREFIAALGGSAIAWPTRAWADERRLVVMLFATDEELAKSFETNIRAGIERAGVPAGLVLVFAVRNAGSDTERLPPLAAELAALNPDVIVAWTNAPTSALHHAAPAVPLVALFERDPTALGMVRSYARPGGVVTGLTATAGEDAQIGKRLELLRDLVPDLRRVGYMFGADNPTADYDVSQARAGAERLGLGFNAFPVRTMDDLEAALGRGTSEVEGMVINLGGSPVLATHADKVAALALRAKMPTVTLAIAGPKAGLLASYGPDTYDLARRLGGYVAKILAGTKPGDLPIEQPRKFQMVINLKTAKTLGLEIPQTLLLRADEVIE